MARQFSNSDLEAYLDEALPPDEMARIEDELRNNPDMGERLIGIHGRRDS